MNAPSESEMLDWLIRYNGLIRIQGSDSYGWCAMDCRNGLTFVGVRNHKTAREAIVEAMEKIP